MESGLPEPGATGEAGAEARQFFRLLSRIRGSNLTAQPAPERQNADSASFRVRRERLVLAISLNLPSRPAPKRPKKPKEGVWGNLRS